MATPKFDSPDGTQRELFTFSVTKPERFFTGTVDSSTVDVQISVRGSAFASDPDNIVLEGNTFTIPNPAVFPDGLGLVAGLNEIKVRAVSNTGTVSDPATAQVRLIQDADVDLIPVAPTNVTVERFDGAVLVRIQEVGDTSFRGINVYASQFAGGGATGYRRVNVNLISDVEFVEELVSITSLEVDGEIVKNPDGTAVADPLYVKMYAAQVRDGDFVQKLEDIPDNEFTPELAAAITTTERENLIQTEYNEIREVPETVDRIRTTSTVQEIRDIGFLSFLHDRQATPSSNPPTIPYGRFAATDPADNLYYVVTAVYFDENDQIEVESANSIEVAGNPVTVSTLLGTYPQIARPQISLEMIRSVQRTRPQVAVQAGAVLRDTVIDPVSSEIERVRFLNEFLNQSQSFPLLLQVDGVDGNGNSIPVSQSPRKLALKRALFLTRDADVQTVVNGAFERLAANFQVFRRPGDRARGEVTFFTTIRPTSSVVIPAGTVVASGAVRFQTTVDASIPIDRLASFFNPITGRFSVTVPVRAEDAGQAGNVGSGQIRSVISGPTGLSVINQAATFGGDNQDTNLEIARRAQNRIASADSGRERGYLQTVAGISGVRQAFVVSAGNELMQRDFEADLGRHVGGKVDIYVRGDNTAIVTDTFAFQFETALDKQFVIVGDPKNLIFRAQDSRLSSDNPIVEMLDDPVIGFEFKNATTGEVFDLTNVTLVDFRTIQLSTDVEQPDVDLTDVVFGDYRFRTSMNFVLPRQPVVSVTQVQGTESGVLPEDGFALVRADSALRTGNSTKAQDFIKVVEVTNAQGATVPTGELITVENEAHVLIGETPDFLDNLGVNSLTIRVFNNDRTVEYKGPNDPSGSPDFSIVLPSDPQSGPTGVRRTSVSTIPTGSQVIVDYRHDENFTVEYTVNNIPLLAQQEIDENRHNTADVIVKSTVQVPVDISATIILQPTVKQDEADASIRADLGLFFDGLTLGTPIRQSDIVGIIESAGGVSHVVVPLTKLVRGPGAPILRENLSTSVAGDMTYIAGNPNDPISTPQVSVFLVREPLTAATSNGGGPDNEFRGVFQDDSELTLLTVRPETLGSAPRQAFIIGNDGLTIPGLTDDATLQAEFPTASAQDIENVRRSRTQNRILISVDVDDSPVNHEYFVTYFVAEENEGVRDIEPGPVEQLIVGELTFTFEEDRG